MKARGVSAQTFNKRLAGAKKRIRQLFASSPEGLDLGKQVRFEEVLKEIKGQKIASSRIDRDSVPTKGEGKTLIKGIRGSKLRHSSTAIILDMYVQDASSWQDQAELWGDLSSDGQER